MRTKILGTVAALFLVTFQSLAQEVSNSTRLDIAPTKYRVTTTTPECIEDFHKTVEYMARSNLNKYNDSPESVAQKSGNGAIGSAKGTNSGVEVQQSGRQTSANCAVACVKIREGATIRSYRTYIEGRTDWVYWPDDGGWEHGEITFARWDPESVTDIIVDGQRLVCKRMRNWTHKSWRGGYFSVLYD